MYWLILLLVLIPLNAFGSFGVSGTTYPRSVAGVSIPESVGGATADYPESVSRWKLEPSALTTDSRSTNTLTNINTVTEDTTNEIEGTGCGNFEYDNDEYLIRADADLTSGFPLKSGNTNKAVTFCGWARIESFTADGAIAIVTKYGGGTDNKRSFNLHINNTTHFARLYLGYNNGDSLETKAHATELSTDTWYLICGSYAGDSTKTWAIRVRSSTGGIVGSDATDAATLDANGLNVEDAPFVIGAAAASGSYADHFDGQLDDISVFSSALTADHVTSISKGVYR